jgi:DNA polymerase-3 subunit gamma/tau
MTEHDQQPQHAEAGPPVPTPRPAPTPSPKPAPPGAPSGDGPTGDAQIDAALAELDTAAPDDLDAQIEAGQRVHRTLQSRLSDLGGQ